MVPKTYVRGDGKQNAQHVTNDVINSTRTTWGDPSWFTNQNLSWTNPIYQDTFLKKLYVLGVNVFDIEIAKDHDFTIISDSKNNEL